MYMHVQCRILVNIGVVVNFMQQNLSAIPHVHVHDVYIPADTARKQNSCASPW